MAIFITLQIILDFFILLTLLRHENGFKGWYKGTDRLLTALEKELEKQDQQTEDVKKDFIN